MNNPCQVSIKFYQGETFNPPPISFVDQNGNAINLAGYTATMMARATVNNQNVEFNANTTNGYLSINATLGQITINIPASVTATMASFNGFYDLFIYSPTGQATRLFGGPICIPESVTR